MCVPELEKELAAHLKRAKNQDLTELAQRAQRYLESNNQKLAGINIHASISNELQYSVPEQSKAKIKNEVNCFSCGGLGHKAVICPSKSNKDLSLRPFYHNNAESRCSRLQSKHITAAMIQRNIPTPGNTEQASQDELESFKEYGIFLWVIN